MRIHIGTIGARLTNAICHDVTGQGDVEAHYALELEFGNQIVVVHSLRKADIDRIKKELEKVKP